MGWLRRLFHRSHTWQTTVYNRYCFPLEQRCDCGKARHIRDFNDCAGHVNRWRDGPHPVYGKETRA